LGKTTPVVGAGLKRCSDGEEVVGHAEKQSWAGQPGDAPESHFPGAFAVVDAVDGLGEMPLQGQLVEQVKDPGYRRQYSGSRLQLCNTAMRSGGAMSLKPATHHSCAADRRYRVGTMSGSGRAMFGFSFWFAFSSRELSFCS